MPIHLLNPSNQPVGIYRTAKLANFTEVDPTIATYELKDPFSSDTETQTTNQSKPVTSKLRSYSEFPHLLESNLGQGQLCQLTQLLDKDSNIFAQSPTDLGYTTLEHTIDVGDHPPL